MLVQGLPEIRFVLVSLMADPSVTPVFELPANVATLITVPLWGTGEVLELRRDLSLGQVIARKRSAPTAVIRSRFQPMFRRFLRLLWSQTAQPALMGQVLWEMASFFGAHDYDVTMRSQPVWECFLAESTQGYPEFCRLLGLEEQAALLDITDAMRLLYRWLTVLTIDIPQVDVVHAAASGLASIPGILAGHRQGASFLLTEHGVYLRERLLALSRSKPACSTRRFKLALRNASPRPATSTPIRSRPAATTTTVGKCRWALAPIGFGRFTTGPIPGNSLRPRCRSPLMRCPLWFGWGGLIL